jgi:hypothetical protein
MPADFDLNMLLSRKTFLLSASLSAFGSIGLSQGCMLVHTGMNKEILFITTCQQSLASITLDGSYLPRATWSMSMERSPRTHINMGQFCSRTFGPSFGIPTNHLCSLIHFHDLSWISERLQIPQLASSDNQGDNKTLDKLLANLRDIFSLDQAFVRDLKRCLLKRNCKILLLFVDLDNVPRFFQHITSDMIASLPSEAFVICSANRRPNTRMWQSAHKIHFTLALPSKDAADAVCTVAMSKLNSVLVAADRQDDVVHVVVSDDRIFEQVCTMSGSNCPSISICHQTYSCPSSCGALE